ncbi:ImuA family protein [Acidimangrovimonas sediminis]|uniref:ImuA family protein n=1 Tax=Acidimangrovimonas sediminis TaxID=2056283 RepID=UPI000C7F7E89|nr:hypothetical protein [Acidimangrovimonas sediminis]
MTGPLSDLFPLRRARVHEAFGPAAPVFAAIAGDGVQGPLLWIRESWRIERLNPQGLAAYLDPARLLIAATRDQTDALAVAEEALRDGVIALVVLETSRPLDLREGRRLQLAARAGQATGLCLIPEGPASHRGPGGSSMGSNAAETRWRCTPVLAAASDHGAPEDSTRMRWEITKNKSGTIGAWDVRWGAQTHRLDVVSAPGH